MVTVLDVDDEPILAPEYDWELTGHCNCPANVCNALVFYDNKWIMYYGGADNHIGCAIAETK